MLFRSLLLAAAGISLAIPSAADAKPERDADRAFEAKREGRAMPLPMILQRVVPRMEDRGAQYIGGPELRGRTYRLKFRDGMQVIWVDVDAATGRIVGSRP